MYLAGFPEHTSCQGATNLLKSTPLFLSTESVPPSTHIATAHAAATPACCRTIKHSHRATKILYSPRLPMATAPLTDSHSAPRTAQPHATAAAAPSRMEKQATINIGTIGHVAHGKTTIVRCITGRSTIRYKAELERNITIKLGYANAKIYQCDCPRPDCYATQPDPCSACQQPRRLVRHVSFVDCPGHDVLMATMLNGTAIMDAALLLVAANEHCPQPQTTEHLFAVEIMNLKRIIVLQNKIDLVAREQALEHHEQIKDFLKIANVTGPIVPVSGQMEININAVLDFLVNGIDEPPRRTAEPPRMVIIRSFDVNRPGTEVAALRGGVIGGSLVTGVLRIGDEIEILPGVIEHRDGAYHCQPYRTRVTRLQTEQTELDEAAPGGLIGVGTDMDPSICRSDKLVGMVMGLRGTLPGVYYHLSIEYELFQKTVSCAREDIRDGEQLLLNIGSTTTGCIVQEFTERAAELELLRPCCCDVGERFAISRKIKNNWRLAGFGTIMGGKKAILE